MFSGAVKVSECIMPCILHTYSKILSMEMNATKQWISSYISRANTKCCFHGWCSRLHAYHWRSYQCFRHHLSCLRIMMALRSFYSRSPFVSITKLNICLCLPDRSDVLHPLCRRCDVVRISGRFLALPNIGGRIQEHRSCAFSENVKCAIQRWYQFGRSVSFHLWVFHFVIVICTIYVYALTGIMQNISSNIFNVCMYKLNVTRCIAARNERIFECV